MVCKCFHCDAALDEPHMYFRCPSCRTRPETTRYLICWSCITNNSRCHFCQYSIDERNLEESVIESSAASISSARSYEQSTSARTGVHSSSSVAVATSNSSRAIQQRPVTPGNGLREVKETLLNAVTLVDNIQESSVACGTPDASSSREPVHATLLTTQSARVVACQDVRDVGTNPSLHSKRQKVLCHCDKWGKFAAGEPGCYQHPLHRLMPISGSCQGGDDITIVLETTGFSLTGAQPDTLSVEFVSSSGTHCAHTTLRDGRLQVRSPQHCCAGRYDFCQGEEVNVHVFDSLGLRFKVGTYRYEGFRLRAGADVRNAGNGFVPDADSSSIVTTTEGDCARSTISDDVRSIPDIKYKLDRGVALPTVPDILSFVREHCPKLEQCVGTWLEYYKEPSLLHASLVQEYEENHGLSDDSDDELPASMSCGSSASTGSSCQTLEWDGVRKSTLPQTNESGYGGAAGSAKPYKKIICQHWSRGKCHRGSDCTFAHGEQERQYWHEIAGAAHTPARVPSSGGTDRRSFLEMLPADIRFCHDSIAPSFKSGCSILSTLRELADGKVWLRSIPKMQVVLYRGSFYSLNNRRLCLYRLCQFLGLIADDTPVKVQLLEYLPTGFESKFTTSCQGDWVRIRRDGRICGKTSDDTTFGREEFLDFFSFSQPR